jgi:U3 small nucleolar RNA-associated protein 23
MRITRKKGIRKTLSFYKTCFGLRDPYRVLIDISYIEAALQGKIHVKDQLLKMLDGRVTPMVTDCVLKEISNGGTRLHGHSIVAKPFYRLKCNHKPSKSSSDCFIDQVNDASSNKGLMVATNDDSLKSRLRSIGGVPVLCIHGQVPILEGPSDQSKLIAKQREVSKSTVPEWEKEIHGLESEDEEAPVKKKKKQKNPNPLSVMKKVSKEVVDLPKQEKRTRRKKRSKTLTE